MHETALYNHLLLAQGERSPFWLRATFVAVFVLICWLRGLPLSAVAYRFELRYQLMQLLLLYHKICPCLLYVLMNKDMLMILHQVFFNGGWSKWPNFARSYNPGHKVLRKNRLSPIFRPRNQNTVKMSTSPHPPSQCCFFVFRRYGSYQILGYLHKQGYRGAGVC